MQVAAYKPRRHVIPLPRGTVMIHANTGSETRVKAFSFMYRLIPEFALANPEAHDNYPYGVEATLKEELARRNPAK